ncbi:hypothetical protein LCGC14_2696970 [marine sediment metagenome]|uniref:6-carboxy-5,6,7,8-tetrahydropterin synthase n=1 Tax=marine sediment metagenome TaxID=412755 RepID=A0A0F9A4E0_9ZZZZ
MYELVIQKSFAGAHKLRDYDGECEKLHGHNWKVEVTFRSEKLNRSGMVIDFKIVKKKLEEILSHLDHSYLNDSLILIKVLKLALLEESNCYSCFYSH